MRILLLRGGALGDFVVTLPAIALLRQRWPHARIELVGNPAAALIGLRGGRGDEAVGIGRAYEKGTASLPRPLHPEAIALPSRSRREAAFAPYLDAVHAQSEMRWSWLGAGALGEAAKDQPRRAFAAWLATFDLVVNFWPDADGAIAADFARLGFVAAGNHARVETPAKRCVSATVAPGRAPAAAHFCAALAPLGLATEDFRAWIVPCAEDQGKAETLLGAPMPPQRFIALHPGSGSPKKNWPLERWLEVLASLPSSHAAARVVVVLGEVENESWSADAERSLPANAIVLRSLPASVLAAVLQQCALFLGHDSGPAHVAAAVGCPCVLVFGPTDPAMWAPPGEHVRVVRRGAATEDVSVSDVLKVLRA